MEKNKAVTFSYDDGVMQDIRFTELMNKYGIKATFNINLGLLSRKNTYRTINNKKICIDTVDKNDIRHIYEGHEIAVHTLKHKRLLECSQDEIIDQVERDRYNLYEAAGYEVWGMAYPGGHINNDERVAQVIKTDTGIEYARTISANMSFDVQSNLYR